MRAALRAGLSIAEYEEMTPYQLHIYLEEHIKKQKEKAKEKVVLAYLVAGWIRAKKMPNLKKVLSKLDDVRPKAMTAEQMFQHVKMLNAALGGTVVEVKDGD